MKRLSSILIIAGICIMLIPVVGKCYTSYKQRILIKQIEVNNLDDLEENEQQDEIIEEINNVTSDAVANYEQLESIFEQEIIENEPPNDIVNEEDNISDIDTPEPLPDNPPSKKPSPPKEKQEVLGIIKIKNIDVNVPIVEGIKQQNLRVGVGHIPGTAKIGEVGNTAIAGHRSYTFGKFFNRLNEVEVGDEILIEVKDKIYSYKVYEKKIVEPDDFSVLNKNDKDKVLTLITCHPIYIASHRLIIHAKMEER